jgi:predicted DNA-binding transcriptional regulator YafY
MGFFDHAEKLEWIKYLAAHKQTGSPLELANKLEISERTLLRMVQHLRDRGLLISYDRKHNSYVVEE